MCPSIFNDYEMSIMGCVQRSGLGVVGIFENRQPTTEAQYFLKVECMN